MPKTAFTDSELDQLIHSILREGGRSSVEELLEHCHQYVSGVDPTGKYLQPYEKYFRKQIVYLDFDVHIRHFLCHGDTVVESDIQFRRPSRFPSPLWNRNRGLVAKLRKLLRQKYGTSGITVKEDDGSRQIHFNASSNSFWWQASTPFEQWESECAIYDEPFSSGQTDPDDTSVRNDFMIMRFRRKAA